MLRLLVRTLSSPLIKPGVADDAEGSPSERAAALQQLLHEAALRGKQFCRFPDCQIFGNAGGGLDRCGGRLIGLHLPRETGRILGGVLPKKTARRLRCFGYGRTSCASRGLCRDSLFA